MFLTVFVWFCICAWCVYICVSLCTCVHIFACVCVCSGVLCGPSGPSTWLGVQQESRSREQQHRGADGVLSPELVSIVLCNWIWSGSRDGCQWEPAIIRCEWDVWYQGWTHTHTLAQVYYVLSIVLFNGYKIHAQKHVSTLIQINQKMCVFITNTVLSSWLF